MAYTYEGFKKLLAFVFNDKETLNKNHEKCDFIKIKLKFVTATNTKK